MIYEQKDENNYRRIVSMFCRLRLSSYQPYHLREHNDAVGNHFLAGIAGYFLFNPGKNV